MSFTSIALRCLACGGKLGSHFLWTGDGAYHHACFPSSPKEDELASLRAQVASLQKELAEVRRAGTMSGFGADLVQAMSEALSKALSKEKEKSCKNSS